ncbi:MAG: 6-pyruvoyl tetrahydropterin synthase family protein, partial [Candidatus Hodarchaeota archaeon]
MKFSIEQNELRYQISVAHFVVGKDYSEAIHGHNMGVSIAVVGSLDPRTKMVIDFLKLHPVVEKILDQWDHRTLIPSESPEFSPNDNNGQIEWTHRGKFYSIPANDVVLLPIENVTVEELARLLVEEIEI